VKRIGSITLSWITKVCGCVETPKTPSKTSAASRGEEIHRKTINNAQARNDNVTQHKKEQSLQEANRGEQWRNTTAYKRRRQDDTSLDETGLTNKDEEITEMSSWAVEGEMMPRWQVRPPTSPRQAQHTTGEAKRQQVTTRAARETATTQCKHGRT